MTKPLPMLIVAIFVPLLGGAMYLSVPMLQPADAAVKLEADEQVEAARRLLYAYNANEERLADVLHDLEADNVDVSLSGEDTERIVEENPDAIDEAKERLGGQTRGAVASRVRQLEDRYHKAGGSDSSPILPSGGFGGSTRAIVKAVRDGVRQREAILKENAKLLDEALAKVTAALAVSKGAVSASNHKDANGVKGIILVAKAGVVQREAWRLRSRADASRRALVSLAQAVHRLAVDQELVERSRVDDRLKALEAESRRFRNAAEVKHEQIKALNETILELRARLTEARRQADAAREAMEALRAQGADLLDPGGAQRFADRYTKLSADYDAALAEAHRIERGTLAGARIDDTGDYVHGRFVPTDAGGEIVVHRGLADYRNDRDTAAGDLAALEETLAGIEEGIAELQSLKSGYEEEVAAATSSVAEKRAQAKEIYARFDEQTTQADAAMERAAGTARQAARAFLAAGRTAANEARDASAKLDTLGPTAKERSPFKLRSEDRWETGQLSNESAQAKYVVASILYDRFAAAASDFDIVARVKADLELAEADPAVPAERRDTARKEAAEAARDAIGDFESSFRPLNSNWTVPAAAAAAHDLLSLLENPEHVKTAIANYEHAITGNESQPYAKPFLERLAILRKR